MLLEGHTCETCRKFVYGLCWCAITDWAKESEEARVYMEDVKRQRRLKSDRMKLRHLPFFLFMIFPLSLIFIIGWVIYDLIVIPSSVLILAYFVIIEIASIVLLGVYMRLLRKLMRHS